MNNEQHFVSGEMREIQEAFKGARWFETDGCYTLFDGQYGSTGKGLLASLIGQTMGHKIDTVTTNAGPNSGHTGYLNGDKILTQQIPVASVVMRNLGYSHSCYLNAGAIIDPNQLWKEICEYGYDDKTLVNESPLFIHPAAAVIKPEHQGDQHSDIASTGKGVGPAMEAKISRNDQAVFGGFTPVAWDEFYSCHNWVRPEKISYANLGRCFVETAQGWSLGINSGFYPYTTSRECSVTQALADLGVSPRAHRKSIVCLRTFPIRVGNTEDGYSGDVYPDQKEVSFDALGQEPEYTTVTGRMRRIFTWSWNQYMDMIRANQPDAVFLNFCNYMTEHEANQLAQKCAEKAHMLMGRPLDFILMGYGPNNEDVVVWEG